jgi:hypothetical protein
MMLSNQNFVHVSHLSCVYYVFCPCQPPGLFSVTLGEEYEGHYRGLRHAVDVLELVDGNAKFRSTVSFVYMYMWFFRTKSIICHSCLLNFQNSRREIISEEMKSTVDN